MIKVCPECGYKNNDSAKECIGCYASLLNVKSKFPNNNKIGNSKVVPSRCPYCDAKMRSNNPVCPSCFKDVNEKVKYSTVSKSNSSLNNKNSISKKFFRIVSIVIIIYISLFGYGYWKASNQLSNGTLNLLVAGVTVQALNPISAKGYRYFIMNKTDMPKRIESFNQ